MGLKDWLKNRRDHKYVMRKYIEPQIKSTRESYANFLMNHGYSKKTAEAEAKKRLPVRKKRKK